MTCGKPDHAPGGEALDAPHRQRIAETLGEAPRDALSALLDYGMSEADIARYLGLPQDLVVELCARWRLPAAR